jgi:hypothetical protein
MSKDSLEPKGGDGESAASATEDAKKIAGFKEKMARSVEDDQAEAKQKENKETLHNLGNRIKGKPGKGENGGRRKHHNGDIHKYAAPSDNQRGMEFGTRTGICRSR